MKIGIDIDDTICDTFNNILTSVCEYYSLSKEELEKMYEKDSDVFAKLPNYDKYARLYYPKIIPELPLFDGVKEVIDKLKDKYEIIFITARSTLGFDDSYKMCFDYLNKNNIYFDKLIVGASDKYKICKENKINYFIDNSIDNCSDVSNLDGVSVLLFENKYNKNYDKFYHVKSWNDIYNYITKDKIY